MSDIAAIAAGLSEARCRTILAMEAGWEYPSGSPPPFRGATLHRLRDEGLTDGECADDGTLYFWLTPLGLAVKAHLEAGG